MLENEISMAEALLEGRELTKHYPVTKGLLQRTLGWVRAVDGVSFTVERGKTLSLVGESGAGKTTTAKAVLLLEKPTSGSIFFNGRNLDQFTPSELKTQYRPQVQAVQQNPWSLHEPEDAGKRHRSRAAGSKHKTVRKTDPDQGIRAARSGGLKAGSRRSLST